MQACDETGLTLTQLVPSLSFLLFVSLVVRQRTPTHLSIWKFQWGMNKSILRRTGLGSDALLSHPGQQITGGHRTITHPDPLTLETRRKVPTEHTEMEKVAHFWGDPIFE